jgi:hypothetical protein
MHTSEEFRSHAAECRRMAESTKEPVAKGTWVRLSEHWERMVGEQMVGEAWPTRRHRSLRG